MSFEDYFDSSDPSDDMMDAFAYAIQSKNRLLRGRPPIIINRIQATIKGAAMQTGNRNRDIRWTTGQGEGIRLEDMEDSHLLNTVAYINRRVEEYNKMVELASRRGYAVPAFTINKQTADYWTNAMLKELNRRQGKKLDAARDTLAAAGITTV